MFELSQDTYLIVKAIHIIAVISWMAGMLYLPRLFVYHSTAKPGGELSETFKIMERRLMKVIMIPAMLVSLGLGIIMLIDMGSPLTWSWWLWVKLAAAFALLVVHYMAWRWMKDFALDRNKRRQVFYRVANEIPTVLIIIIVVFSIIKPGM